LIEGDLALKVEDFNDDVAKRPGIGEHTSPF
jgi:hypothetical protein